MVMAPSIIPPGGASGPQHAVFYESLFPSEVEEVPSLSRLLTPYTLPLQSDFRPTNLCYCGRRGKGKSLAMVAIAKMLAPMFQQCGWRIQANIPVDFSDIGVKVNSHPLLGSYISANMDMAERSLLMFDELTEIVPSRRSMSRANVNSNSVMVQIRKLMCEVHGSTQFPTDIDRQMQRQLDLYILCAAHIPRDARWNPYAAARAFIRLYIFDIHGQFWGPPTRFFPPPLNLAKVMYLHNLPWVWNNYQTRFRVVSEHAPESVQARMIGKHWDMDAIEAMEEEADQQSYDHAVELDPAKREYDQAVEARFAEASAEPPPTGLHINFTPRTVDEFLAGKASAGRFTVTTAIIGQLQRVGADVHNLSDVAKLLERSGFEISGGQGSTYYAQVKR